jgi:hypothetical protein
MRTMRNSVLVLLLLSLLAYGAACAWSLLKSLAYMLVALMVLCQ